MRKSNTNSTSSSSSATESAPELFVRSRTDWERVDALSEDEIDTSEIPPLTEADFARSEWRLSASTNSGNEALPQVMVKVFVDEDILAWFQSQGQDYPQRMRAALRLYAEAHRTTA